MTEHATVRAPATLPIARAAGLDPLSLVREVTAPTPLELAPELDPRWQLLLKREDRGPGGAFKWRGALCACAAFAAAGARAVVTSSTGNHGVATAWAASKLGLSAHVVLPVRSSAVKRELIARHGAQLHEHGEHLTEAADRAASLARELQAPLFVDGGCEAQLMGTETVGLELLDARADAVLVPLACGALAGGLVRALSRLDCRPRVIGVQSAAFSRFSAVWHGDPDPGPSAGSTIADGLADNRLVEPAFSACAGLDEVLLVDEEALVGAVRELFDSCGIVVEAAAAAGLAALRSHPEQIPAGRVVLVVSGQNLDQATASQIFAQAQ
ncbi:MAG: PLP-dependent lyase/thiolase [Actinomycetota bacterium]|nr:PLP-dependent lyase/thiolase [Actinomycetota bacterium]